MEQILTAIIDKLQENAVALGLSYIDEEYGQVDIIDDASRETYPVTFPAVLVDAQGTTWQNLGEMHQKGTASIAVNIYLDCYDDTHAYSNTIDKVRERMELVRNVTELLQGWEPVEGGGSLIRQSSAATTNNHGIKLYQTVFSMPIYEDFADRRKAEVRTVSIQASIVMPPTPPSPPTPTGSVDDGLTVLQTE